MNSALSLVDIPESPTGTVRAVSTPQTAPSHFFRRFRRFRTQADNRLYLTQRRASSAAYIPQGSNGLAITASLLSRAFWSSRGRTLGTIRELRCTRGNGDVVWSRVMPKTGLYAVPRPRVQPWVGNNPMCMRSDSLNENPLLVEWKALNCRMRTSG